MNALCRHKPTGNLYEKLLDALDVETKNPVVVYRSLSDKRVWVRDAVIFNERFEKADETCIH